STVQIKITNCKEQNLLRCPGRFRFPAAGGELYGRRLACQSLFSLDPTVKVLPNQIPQTIKPRFAGRRTVATKMLPSTSFLSPLELIRNIIKKPSVSAKSPCGGRRTIAAQLPASTSIFTSFIRDESNADTATKNTLSTLLSATAFAKQLVATVGTLPSYYI
uniref:hypothetical protein n=1 Tax=Mariprofundus ferrooxydans TaxID=314344 RepID=UPI001982313F